MSNIPPMQIINNTHSGKHALLRVCWQFKVVWLKETEAGCQYDIQVIIVVKVVIVDSCSLEASWINHAYKI